MVDKQKFWERIEKSDGCWNWTAAKSKAGYGQIRSKGITYYAHRLMWEELYGKIPKGYYICHHCDNPACVRPEHLFLGTSKDNHQDCMRKGRDNIGERNGWSKLTADEVLAIRRLWYGRIPTRLIAQMFGVGTNTVYCAGTYRSWRHLP